MLTSIAGRACIVTGGAAGIGKGIARVFAAHGARVMVADRNGDDAGATVEAIRAAGGTAEAAACDVSDWDQVRAMVEATARTFGGVDILCANAGIYPQTKMVDMDPAEWDRVLAVNLKGTFLCVKACLPWFEAAGRGRVVVTSSITGPVTGFPGWTHYGASKAGQLGFLRTAAMELARYNTTINAVQPGNIATEGLSDLGDDYLATMAASIPLKRLGAVEDIANTALFFASDEAGYITGQALVVDGGQILPESLEALQEIGG
ncbi:3-oxoacyl-ACP reductase FabG [Roseospira goensis]|uniref:3-oxoacyl-[acyl-carrier protein] reductase n=1 Tax=Roseospira goensis TaxID=391922 RepID=A0A7W6S3D5_9PROT|nr:3-oxoacyl-ACP reductase FabG [Roseospira goensis]MBB4287439.1 3-oxoacyl-[acyl-carrier protein] reductase [Roseospira goensis]